VHIACMMEALRYITGGCHLHTLPWEFEISLCYILCRKFYLVQWTVWAKAQSTELFVTFYKKDTMFLNIPMAYHYLLLWDYFCLTFISV
jgi:hypothetical protein